MSRWIAFVVVVVLFGANFPIMRLLSKAVPPLYGAALRFLIAAAIMALIVAVMKIPLPKGKSLTAAAAYGLLAYGGTFGCLFTAVSIAGAGPVAVLFATAPLFTALLASAFGVEKLTIRKLLGTLAAFVGSAWIYWKGIELDMNPLAFILSIAGAAFAGLATVILKRAPRSHPIGTNTIACSVGGTFLIALAFFRGGVQNDHWTSPALIALGWLALVGTVGGFTLVTWLVLNWNPTKVNYQTVLSPIVASIVAYFLLDEPIRSDLVYGAIAVLAGGWAVLLEASARAPAPAAVPAARREAG